MSKAHEGSGPDRGGRPPTQRISIGRVLERLEAWYYGGSGKSADEIAEEICRETGMKEATYKNIKSGRTNPTVAQIGALAHFFRIPYHTFFEADPDLSVYRNGGACFELRGNARGPREEALRMAALGALLGESVDEIDASIRRLRDFAGRSLDERTLRWMARGGLALGLVELAQTPEPSQFEDEELSAELTAALGRVSEGRELRVRVVRNLAHKSFTVDPCVPFLIARVAHELVGRFLEADRNVYTIGVAGGVHVDTFVRSISPTSSPFPDPSGSDRSFRLVPLTLEPFHDHRLGLADALAGELAAKASHLLGLRRVTAPSFKPFGFLVDGDVGRLQRDSAVLVRQHYGDLDVAIYGCGATDDDGWIARTLQDLGFEPRPKPVTDVCLNMLDAGGNLVPLPSQEGRRREFLGVRLRDIQRLARSPEKLALLLTSGADKGLPITVVARAGCADTIICDEAAAREALRVLKQG